MTGAGLLRRVCIGQAAGMHPASRTRAAPAPAAPGWGADLCHPVPLCAVLLLAVNDHLLKGAGLLPGWMTGKLSDVAGLFYFPLFCVAVGQGVALVAGLRAGRLRGPLAALSVLGTGVAFAAAKLVPAVNGWLCEHWGVIRLDPTDLLALPVLALSAAWLRRGTVS